MAVLPSVEEMQKAITAAGISRGKLERKLEQIKKKNVIARNNEKVAYRLAAAAFDVKVKIQTSSLAFTEEEVQQKGTTPIGDIHVTNLKVVNICGRLVNIGDERMGKNEKPYRRIAVADESGTTDFLVFSGELPDFMAANFEHLDPILVKGLMLRDRKTGDFFTRVGKYSKWEKYDAPDVVGLPDLGRTPIAELEDEEYTLVGGSLIKELDLGTKYSGCTECRKSIDLPVDSRTVCTNCRSSVNVAEFQGHVLAIADESGDLTVDVPAWINPDTIPELDVGDFVYIYGGPFQEERNSLSAQRVHHVPELAEKEFKAPAIDTDDPYEEAFLLIKTEDEPDIPLEYVDKLKEVGAIYEPEPGKYAVTVRTWKEAQSLLASKKDVEPEPKPAPSKGKGKDPSPEQIKGAITHFQSIISMWEEMTPNQLQSVLANKEGGVKFNMEPIIDALVEAGEAEIEDRDGDIFIKPVD